MKLLSNTYFPVAGMKNLRFKTIDGKVHTGYYDFNENYQRRWFDENGNQYGSNNDVIEWEETVEEDPIPENSIWATLRDEAIRQAKLLEASN